MGGVVRNGVCLVQNQWGYHIPAETEDRARLRDLCQQAVGFENHFLSICRDYFLGELRSGNEQRAFRALQHMETLVYPDEQVIFAVEGLGNDFNGETQRSADDLLNRIHKVQTPQSL